MSRTEAIQPADLPVAVQRTRTTIPTPMLSSLPASRNAAMDGASREYLTSLLRENAGNVSRCAAQAGMSRQGMHKLLKKHQLDAAEFRP
jgi:two-component system response regulator HydG